jgi:hypothetical protein
MYVAGQLSEQTLGRRLCITVGDDYGGARMRELASNLRADPPGPASDDSDFTVHGASRHGSEALRRKGAKAQRKPM